MPEKSGPSGWRKRIHSRPSATKLNTDDHGLAEDSAEGLLRPSERNSWMKSIHSRPGTPISRAATPTAFQLEAEDARSELTLELPTPRKATKPKLARYLSGYRSLKDASKEPEFAEPWNEEAPQSYLSPVDPLVSLQSVYSHMTAHPSRAIPPEYNSGLFKVFEDYRKVREEKERVEDLLQETFEGYRTAEQHWTQSEAQYQAEIRRLELLIAQGTSGMSGLMKARQESVLKKGRVQHRKTISSDHLPTAPEHIPFDQLDKQIKLRSQEVLFQRPVSPSSKMVALSRQFSTVEDADDILVGTPPTKERKITLSRKVQSELNLASLGDMDTINSVPRSVDSGFSGAGDPLPDEVESLSTMVDPAIDSDAFMALQELGTLVARKKGIDTKKFLKGLVQLYSTAAEDGHRKLHHEPPSERMATIPSTLSVDPVETPSSPNRSVGHVRPHPHIASTQRRRRHFSFEPGDDQIAALDDELKAYQLEDPYFPSNSTELGVCSGGSLKSPSLQGQGLNAEIQKSSKIPSPIQRPALGSLRRETSVSSLHTPLGRTCTDERRDSRSSVLTAFRQNSARQSSSSSVNTLRHGESQQSSPFGSLGAQNSMAVLAASRALDNVDNSLKHSTRCRTDHSG